MTIVGIDQATLCGYAVAVDGVIKDSGTWNLKGKSRTGESRGMRYIRFEKHLQDVIGKYHPDMICHEQTLLRGGAATEIANSLKGLILMTAEKSHVPVTCVHASELKKFATGHGNADKSMMVYEAEKRLGRKVVDDNEADAVLIALWAHSSYGIFG